MKFIVRVLLLCLLPQVMWAQFLAYSQKDIDEFITKPLVVVTNEHFKDDFKSIVENEWKVGNPSIKFASSEEAEKLAETEPGKYSFLKINAGKFSYRSGSTTYKTDATSIVGYHHTEKDKYPFVMRIPFVHYPLSPLDMQIAIRQFNVHMKPSLEAADTKNVERDIALLSKKTLLLPKELTPEGLTEDDFKAKYEGKVEIKSWEEIHAIIDSDKKGDYAFLYILIQPLALDPAWVAIDAANFDVLALTTFGGLHLGYKTDSGDSENFFYWRVGKERLAPKDISVFLKKGAQTINRRTVKG